MVYSTIYEYVDESGRSFFYRTSKAYYQKGEKPDTMDEIKFINSQGVSCVIESYAPNYNKEEMIKELKRIYRDSIRVLYNQNKAYMERNFPNHTYTFDEVYNFAEDVADGMVWIGYDSECCIQMYLCFQNILTHKLEKVKKYPYILGYLYTEVKYYDGEKCKLQHLSGIKIN
jgi:uncharacterized protein YozE (UPF0346 family)